MTQRLSSGKTASLTFPLEKFTQLESLLYNNRMVALEQNRAYPNMQLLEP